MTKIIFLGTGPSSPILEFKEKSRRLQTSTLFIHNKKNILIDAGQSIKKQLDENHISKINICLFTHFHSDAIDGISSLNGYTSDDFTTYIPEKMYEKGKKKIQRFEEFLNIETIGGKFTIDDFSCSPFLVEHDIIRPKRFLTFGYHLIFGKKKITYASDILNIPKDSEKFFHNLDILIVDGAGWESPLVTHQAIIHFLEKSEDWNIGKIYFVQIGRPVPKHEEANKKIQKLNENAQLAYDGLRINI